MPPYPWTYCNKCLVQVLENPLGCYGVSRYTDRVGYEAMINEVMAIFEDETDGQGRETIEASSNDHEEADSDRG